MESSKIRQKFLSFFKNRGHIVLDSASLVTTDEKGVTNSTLFNTAGMQPLVPYLLGKPHPKGNRLCNIQKCLRTVDVDDIGDNTHATFFEMLGNWSLGDYFKKEAINWSYEFLTSKTEGLGLDPSRLYITVFEGDQNASKDLEAYTIWTDLFKKAGIDGERIFYMPAESNWWQAGENGPCGPDTEMYFDIKNKFNGRGISKEEFLDADSKKEIVEVWNDVFMQYEKKDGKIIGNLPKPSVDTGAGLERLSMIMQDVDNIYETDLLKPVIDKIKELSKKWNLRSARIVADHIRASVFILSEEVLPTNTDRGYVLRKLLRRSVRHSDLLEFENDKENEIKYLSEIAKIIIKIYSNIYPNVYSKKESILDQITKEEFKFRETLKIGLKEFEKGKDPFVLFSSYGFPIELTIELAKEKGIKIDIDKYNQALKEHQNISRSGAENKFKGGLADPNNDVIVKYHTATHLLHQALHDVLGQENGNQKGSNITTERLRFDFTYNQKVTDDQKKEIEKIVNQKIKESLPVNKIILPKDQAEKIGARMFFGEKYQDQVSVYYIGSNLETAYSKEFCGGPHVKNTRELGEFKIIKEESISTGVRRIKAVLK